MIKYFEAFAGAVADKNLLLKWAVERLEQIESPQMKIRVFQIDHDKDRNDLVFMNYDYTQSHGGVKAENYRQVYGDTVNCDCFESVFAPGYLGESMSVSNIIEVCGVKIRVFTFATAWDLSR